MMEDLLDTVGAACGSFNGRAPMENAWGEMERGPGFLPAAGLRSWSGGVRRRHGRRGRHNFFVIHHGIPQFTQISKLKQKVRYLQAKVENQTEMICPELKNRSSQSQTHARTLNVLHCSL